MIQRESPREAVFRAVAFAFLAMPSFSFGAEVSADLPRIFGPSSALAEDLGPGEIDVSGYPEKYQRAYREIFVPAFRVWGRAARVLNSPLVEMDAKLEAQERRREPGLFSDPTLVLVSRDGWARFVDGLYRKPPCCGACPTLSVEQARALRDFLVYDSLARKTGRNAPAWMRQRRALIRKFGRAHLQGAWDSSTLAARVPRKEQP